MCGSKKVINVILNSNNAISGYTNSNANYYVDWSAILKDNTPYQLHWCYVGQANTLTLSSKLAQIQVNFQMENLLFPVGVSISKPTLIQKSSALFDLTYYRN
jgi:hypothetical protein